MKYRLYKDAELSETIERIKLILSDHGISVTEKMSEGFDGVFSVRVIINGLGVGTNGKGLTQEAALASAYGELMERIQNFALYKFTFPVKEGVYNSGFYYAPDEKIISCDEYEKYIKVFKEAIDTEAISVNDLMTLGNKFEVDNNVVICVPYINYGCEESVLVPAKLIEHIYASNGMAAGNTYPEAMVQSISEMFERYANKVMIDGNIIPPEIPIEDIDFSPDMRDVISRLKKKGNYNITFKDCSLGMGLPVAGMYFIDMDTGKYFVKFGAHPVLSIAAERTITELFQGRKFLNSNLWLKRFSFSENINIERNFEKIFRDGDGVYHYNIFSENNSYPLSDCWYKGEHYNNEFLLEFLFHIIKNNDWSLFYRDVSFLGFPAIHAFIPEISHANKINQHYLDKQYQYRKIKECMKSINNCGVNELMNIIKFIDSNYYAAFDTIHPLIGLPLSKDGYFGEMNNLYFKFLLYYKMGDYENGLKSLDTFIKNNNYLNSKNGTLYRCLREAVYALHIAGIERREAEEILRNIYDSGLVQRVMSMICNNGLYDEFQELPCFECEGCLYNESCRYPHIIKFDNEISRKYSLWKERLS